MLRVFPTEDEGQVFDAPRIYFHFNLQFGYYIHNYQDHLEFGL